MHILNSFSRYAMPIFNEVVIQPLTTQEKRILLVASLAFSFLAACYLISRCPFQIRWIDPSKTDLYDQSKAKENKDDFLDFHTVKKEKIKIEKKTEHLDEDVSEMESLDEHLDEIADNHAFDEDLFDARKDGVLNETGMIDNFTGSDLENELKKDNKYYFIHQDLRSYLLIELVHKALANLEREKDGVMQHNLTSGSYSKKSGFDYFFATPLGHPFRQQWVKLSETVDQVTLKIIDNIKFGAIVDWARTTNQKHCSLTLEKFDKPYILNLNGRTYSKHAILKAMETSIFKDEPLRLEDITLQPSKLENMIFYPNLSLWAQTPKTLRFNSDEIKYKDYNEAEAKAKNIPGFSSFIAALPPTKNGMLDGTKIYNYYATARSLPQTKECLENCVTSETIEDLVIQHIEFPKHHPKTGITFRNILFEKCKIDMQCWCGIKVKSSKMSDCTIDLRSPQKPPILKKTKLVNCKIIIDNNGHLKPGAYPKIEKNPKVLEYIHKIVEDGVDLENCTLEVK